MKFSSGFVAASTYTGYWQNLANGKLRILGATTEPTTADAAETGTLLGTLTLSGAAHTPETRAEWKCTLGGASGTLDTLLVGLVNILPSAVTYITDLSTTAALVATTINNACRSTHFVARSSGADVYILAPIGSATVYNAVALTATSTTLTCTIASTGYPASSGGTAGVAAVNGLNFQFPAVAGVLTKETTLWEDTSADATGTSVYARLILDKDDDNLASTAYRRVQFSIGTSGADITSQILTTTLASPIILSTGTFTLPTTS